MYYTLQTENLTGDNAYFNLKHTNYIAQNLTTMKYDATSYDGKFISYPHGFHYIMAFFSYFIGLNLAYKIIPEILIAFLVIVVYLISKELTKNNKASMLAALISAFIPLLIRETLNKGGILSLMLPLMFYGFYCFIKLNESQKYVIQFIIISTILPFIDPTSFVLMFTLIILAVLLYSESIELGNLRKESIFLSIFLILIGNFIVLKNIFHEYGIDVLRSGIPQEIFQSMYRDVSILSLIYFLGISTLFLGLIGVYYGLVKVRRRSVFLILSMMITILLIIVTKFIDFASGLVFLGVSLAILSSLAISNFLGYLQITKINKYENWFYLAIIIMVIIFNIYPSLNIAQQNINNAFTQKEILALKYLNSNADINDIIVSKFDEGNFISYFSGRRTFMDTYLLLSDDIEDRLRISNSILTNPFMGIAVNQAKRYSITYIYLSDRTEKQYGLDGLKYYSQDSKCFDKVFENADAKIYKIKC